MDQPTSLSLGPQRNRRRRKRVLTKENVFFASVAVLVIFAGLSLWGEKGGADVGEMNRLFAERTSAAELSASGDVVVEEGATGDRTYADPLLVSHARRSALLGVNGQSFGSSPVSEEGYEIEELEPRPVKGFDIDAPLAVQGADRKEAKYVISGGEQGVELEAKPDGQQ